MLSYLPVMDMGLIPSIVTMMDGRTVICYSSDEFGFEYVFYKPVSIIFIEDANHNRVGYKMAPMFPFTEDEFYCVPREDVKSVSFPIESIWNLYMSVLNPEDVTEEEKSSSMSLLMNPAPPTERDTIQ